MQITLKIALAAAAFAAASMPALAFDIPPDGTKNFSAPSDTPSYFTDETLPEASRVNPQETFTSQEVQEPLAAEEGTVSPVVPETGRYGRHPAGYRYGKHAHGRWHGTAAFHYTARQGNAAKSGGQAGARRTYSTKHARMGTRQHAAAMLPIIG